MPPRPLSRPGATPRRPSVQVLYRFATAGAERGADFQADQRRARQDLEDAAGELKRGIENVEYACAAPEILARASTAATSARTSTPGATSSRSAWSPGSPCSTSRRWCRCGCTCWPSPAATPSSSSPPSATPAPPCDRRAVPRSRPAEGRAERGARRQGSRGRPAPGAGSESHQLRRLDPIAEYIYAEGTKRGKRVQALGGAKNHAVLMPDADPTTPSALMGAAYGSCGERCMAISVAVCVGDQVADALIAKLVPQIKALKIGAGTSCGLDMGPLVTAAAQAKVTGYIDSGVRSWWWTAAATRSPATRTASSSAAACSTGDPGNDHLQGRDLRPAAWFASTAWKRPCS